MATPPPPPPASPPPPPPPTPPPPPPAPAKGSNRALIIVLCIIGALVLLIGGCTVTCAYFARKAAKGLKQYSEEAQKNPAYATLAMAAAITPDVQVVSKDAKTGKITLKNKKTGEVVTIDTTKFNENNINEALEQFSKGLKPAAPEETAPAASEPSTAPETPAEMETAAAPEQEAPPPGPKISAGKAAALAATVKRFPAFVSAYPGAQTTEATQQTFGPATVGNYEFLTSDSAESVADYYEKKLTSAGFTIAARNSGTNDNGATVTMVATSAESQRSCSVNAEAQAGGKVRANVTFTVAKP